jgi:hypothetical protein
MPGRWLPGLAGVLTAHPSGFDRENGTDNCICIHHEQRRRRRMKRAKISEEN